MKNLYLIVCFFIHMLSYVPVSSAARSATGSDRLNSDSVYNLINQDARPDIEQNNKEIYDYLYRSLYYYEQLGNRPDLVTDIIITLTEEASIREDTTSIKQLLIKAEKLQQKSPEDHKLNFVINTLYASLYKIKYNEIRHERLIDSILLYKNNSVKYLYEAEKVNHKKMSAPIGLIYTQIAEYELKRTTPDFETINQYIQKAKDRADMEKNLLLHIRISYVQSLVYYATQNMQQAEAQAGITNELIDKYRKFGYQQLYANNYALLSKINEAKEDYKNALKYEDFKSDYELEIHNNDIKTIELQIITEAKNAEVSDLKTQSEFHKKRSTLIIVICILLFVTVILLLAFFYVKRKHMEQSTALEKKEKEDAKLKLKLKNEQAEKALFEKFEVLSDFHLKEMELMGKSKELGELEAEKRILDEQVELFARKTAEYENLIHAQHDSSKELPIFEIIKEDLEQLISKHLKNNKTYIEKLYHLNEAFINNIKDRYDGNISIQYIKYCICFTINMGIAEVSACFSIEPASVHGLRYRLKKKFGLGPDDSLELFLISIYTNTVSTKTTD